MSQKTHYAKSAEKKRLRYAGFAAILLFAWIIQFTPRAMPEIFGAYPQPVLMIVICIAMLDGDLPGASFGAVAGMMIDSVSQNGSGVHALLYMLTGIFCGLMVENLMQNNLLSCLALTGVSAFFNITANWLLKTAGKPGNYILSYLQDCIPAMIYTVIAIIPVYLIFNRVFGRKKFIPPSLKSYN